MKTQVEVIKNFDWFEEGDVLTLNNETLQFELKKEVDRVVNNKIKTYNYILSLSIDFVLEYLDKYLIAVEEADELDKRDLEIKKLQEELKQLKNRTWYRW